MHDLIIFGATGFTGKYVVETAVKTLKSGKGDKFTYAVAGRSKGKIDSILKEVSDSTGEDLQNVPVILADVSDQKSLVDMAKQCKVLLNCVGPYRFSGKEVVDACIEAGASCVDVSGEPEYLERVQLYCDEDAKKKGVYIVGSCGFDSIPADMGVAYLLKNFGGDVNSVEEYVETENKGKPTKIHYGTWASAVHGVANAKNLRPIREDLFKIEPQPPKPRHKLARRPVLHYNDIVKAWCLPFPGSDRSVVMRSQNLLYRLRNQRPVQSYAYVKMGSLISSLILMFAAVVFGVLVYVPFGLGQWLLLTFPRLMSFGFVTHEGPSREEMDKLEFTVTLYGEGWADKLTEPTDQHAEEPNKKKIVKVHGVNPGYGATCVCILQSALTILKEKNKMPANGGVYPPAAAFSETTLIKRLQENGVTFDIQDA
ncbi:unnamed protein product [Orchesella dallaii]|uniref:Saccharopine dehydrogenase NADP binding domain-containing protein n=1 Tax=Orchesella dallaii TaxID=48710 RepID=A0ABP1RU15_9HEXA